jgi:hypothetical protein
MSDFFDDPRVPEPSPPEPRYRMPPWFGPPRGELAGVVAAELLIARTERVAVAVAGIRGFTTGFAFDLVTLSRDEDEQLDPFLFGPPHHRGAAGGLRFGIEFSDGRRATGGDMPPTPADPGDGPVLHGGGGGGGGGRWRIDQWVWPLPPPGPVAFVCDWEEAGVPLSRAELDAEEILAASRRAQVVYDDSHLPPWPAAGEDAGPGWMSASEW